MTELLDVPTVDAAPPEWVIDALGGATGSGIRVAVLDSGWDRAIGDPRVLPGVGFVDPDDDFALANNDDDQDVLGHGTACAGVILEVAPDARILPVKVFGNTLETSPGTLVAALHWAIEAGVQVINVSLGTRLEGTLHALYATCEKARRAGIIVVAAGHNANDWSYPAIFENVIGVSAARFQSPYHFHYRSEHAHECEGWGVDRPVLWIGGGSVVKHGTSFAAPGITGIVCLIKERHPDATLEDVREMLARFALPAPPEKAARRGRRRASAPAETPPSESARKPRKPAAKPAAEDDAAPARAAKPRRKPAAPAAETAAAKAPTKPRKRAGAADQAEVKAPSRSRKPAVAEKAAPAKPSKRAASAKKEAEPAKPARRAPSVKKDAAAEDAKPPKRTKARAVRGAARSE